VGVNIWNSYMLICIEGSVESYFDLVMGIERDTTALRKYIIWQESDLNRIPFLDNTISEDVKPNRILEKEFEGNNDVKDLINSVQELTLQSGGKVPRNRLRETLKKTIKETKNEDTEG